MRSRRIHLAIAILGALAASSRPAAADLDSELRKCLGTARGGCVADADLKRCLQQVDPVSKDILKNTRLSAEQRARALEWRFEAVRLLCRGPLRDDGCGGSTVERVAMVLDYSKRPQPDLIIAAPRSKQPESGFKRWTVGRRVTDDLDPTGGGRTTFPAMLAYSHDMREPGGEDVIVKGSARVMTAPRDIASGQAAAGLGVQMDTDSQRPAKEGRVDIIAPISLSWTWPGHPILAIESLQLTISPDFQTDRLGRRHVYLGTAGVAMSGPLGAGFQRKLGMFSYYFLPAAQLELGNVQDAGGSAKYEGLKASGTWNRPVLDIVAELKLPVGTCEWSLSVEPTLRYDSRSTRWSTYGEEVLALQFDQAGHWFMAASYSDGMQPPTLAPTTSWMLGLGVKY